MDEYIQFYFSLFGLLPKRSCMKSNITSEQHQNLARQLWALKNCKSLNCKMLRLKFVKLPLYETAIFTKGNIALLISRKNAQNSMRENFMNYYTVYISQPSISWKWQFQNFFCHFHIAQRFFSSNWYYMYSINILWNI